MVRAACFWILIGLLPTLSAVGQGDTPPQALASAPDGDNILRKIGFPFDEAARLARSPDLRRIAEILERWDEQGLFAEGADTGEIFAALDICRGRNTRFALARVNLNTLQQILPAEESRRLMAVFVWMNHTGHLRDPDVLLEYALVYLGSAAEAETSAAMGGPRPSFDLTEEQRLALWPAAHALIANASASVPLLREAVSEPSYRELIRLRAAAFLREIAPETLTPSFVSALDPPLDQEVQCLKEFKVHWKSVLPNLCAHLQRLKGLPRWRIGPEIGEKPSAQQKP